MLFIVTYPVCFFGQIEKYTDDSGVERVEWNDGQVFIAQAYDTHVLGYNTYNTNNLRLWKRNKKHNAFYCHLVQDRLKFENAIKSIMLFILLSKLESEIMKDV